MIRSASLAGFLGLTAFAAQAQTPPAQVSRLDPVVVTATRAITAHATLRDAIVITRDDLDGAGSLSLGEVLARLAGIELRATGGAGQPQGVFIRGSSAQQTLVLVDGMRVGSATTGATALENIPLELIERIEVVKGPLSSLWGADAMGGVIQVFTRGKQVPHLFVASGYGGDRERRIAAGVTTVERDMAAVLSLGYRDVDARSATTQRAPFCYDPDRDPHTNAFMNLRVAQRMWQGENVVLEAFATQGKTHFDGCGANDRNKQTIAGMRLTSSARFADNWTSRFTVGQGIDRIELQGASTGRLETRQDQGSWVNELAVVGGSMVLGAETVRQRVAGDAAAFTRSERKTDSVFAGITQAWEGQRAEASWRHDRDDSFGNRSTGALGYGIELGAYRLSTTLARGFRSPTFYDLYGPTSAYFEPNPNLRPEQNRSREFALSSSPDPRFAWRLTVYDNRVEDLIAFTTPTVANVDRARIRGVEVSAQGTAWGVDWKASITGQRPRDEATGMRLQGRAERFGTASVSRTWGNWTAGLGVHASGERHDSADENPASRLPAYATADARLRYRMGKHWSAELHATNLTDKRYETAVGYEGARRSLYLSLRFEAF